VGKGPPRFGVGVDEENVKEWRRPDAYSLVRKMAFGRTDHPRSTGKDPPTTCLAQVTKGGK